MRAPHLALEVAGDLGPNPCIITRAYGQATSSQLPTPGPAVALGGGGYLRKRARPVSLWGCDVKAALRPKVGLHQ